MTQDTPASLAGKTALVTGGAHRIGAAISRRLHAAGAHVVIHYRRSREAAEALADALNAQRAGSASTVGADLMEVGALAGCIGETIRLGGRLDLLVNNAAGFYPTPFDAATPAQWDDLIGTNLRAPFFLAQAAAPELRARRGVIINLVDIHADRPLGDHPVYSIAKAGMAMLTRSLARELGPEVRVNGVSPGAILWPEAGADAAEQQAILARVVLERLGDPDDIAGAVLYLARDAGYVTGQILAVDGGQSVVHR